MINVIAVDDESDVKVLFEHFFRKEVKEGLIRFQFIDSPKDCIPFLSGVEGDNTVVLSDINMPLMSGIELLKAIRGEFKGVRVILISAYEVNKYSSEMEEYGADGFIGKPVDFYELKSKIFDMFNVSA